LLRFLALLSFAVLPLLLTGCGGRPSRSEPATYTVKPGDTLYSIAWRHNLDYRELAVWNHLPVDYGIYPGQVLYLHLGSGQYSARVPKRSSGSTTPPTRSPSPPPVPPGEAVSVWVWPTQGSNHVVRHTATGSEGLLIAGAEGQEIKAAASGTVVYTGGGLRGFGQLVIIKHSSVFLSAYGHNRTLKVTEGARVTAGQTIAAMGLGPGQKPALYFEIRLNGRPVDPLQYLPKQ
jgi:lipoprotein NlpD